MGQGLEYRRLRAPKADGATLIEPPLSAAGDLIARNASLVAAADYDLQGRPLAEVARLAREELLAESLAYTRKYRDVVDVHPDPAAPIVVAGHQPQLFHPGVWFKNFVLSGLATAHGATAVNLVIDSDTIKSAALRVPGGSALEPIVESLPLDRVSAEIPYEERGVLDPELLRSFGQRALAVIKGLVPNPLLGEFWPLVTERLASGANLGECLSQARHIQEGRWGSRTLELPQSRICGLEAFHWFACHLLDEAPRFRETYNAAVAEYRRVNHVRSLAHPVPDLAESDGWLEAPFWVWCSQNPRRRRLFVRRQGDDLLLTDRAKIQVRIALPSGGDARHAVGQLAELAPRGIKIRTRALATTLFARLLAGDLFLHGLGGAKYDQVTDLLMARFFGIEPPGYLTATATLRLPIQRQAVTLDDRRLIDARLRELAFHPERHANGAAEDAVGQGLIASKQRWIATPQSIENARERCHAIRQANEGLQPWVARLRDDLLAERERLNISLQASTILASRDFGFCLYPEATLRELMNSVERG